MGMVMPTQVIQGAAAGTALSPGLGTVIGGGLGLLGSLLGQRSASRDRSRDREMQYEFARKGIQWRVADAKAAGINPLYAIGATPTQATPVSVGSDPAAAQVQAGDQLKQMMTGIIQMRLQNAEVDRLKSETMLNAAKARNALTSPMGTLDRPYPLMQTFRDNRTGKLRYLPSQQAAESIEGGHIVNWLTNPLLYYGAGAFGKDELQLKDAQDQIMRQIMGIIK